MCVFILVPFRAEGILNRGNVDAFALEESQNLSIFFATNNSITIMLKKALEEVRNGGKRKEEGQERGRKGRRGGGGRVVGEKLGLEVCCGREVEVGGIRNRPRGRHLRAGKTRGLW